jgi:uncharacterized protein YndB with AHSA1/START domain
VTCFWGPSRLRVALGNRNNSREVAKCIPTGSKPEDTRVFDLTFAELRPDAVVVLKGAFESEDSAMASEMKLTFTLEDEAGRTRITLHHEGIPDAISVEDNERGSESSLTNLARLLEGRWRPE